MHGKCMGGGIKHWRLPLLYHSRVGSGMEWAEALSSHSCAGWGMGWVWPCLGWPCLWASGSSAPCLGWPTLDTTIAKATGSIFWPRNKWNEYENPTHPRMVLMPQEREVAAAADSVTWIHTSHKWINITGILSNGKCGRETWHNGDHMNNYYINVHTLFVCISKNKIPRLLQLLHFSIAQKTTRKGLKQHRVQARTYACDSFSPNQSQYFRNTPTKVRHFCPKRQNCLVFSNLKFPPLLKPATRADIITLRYTF